MKKFFIILGVSVGVWILSGILQAFTGFSDYFTVTQKCSLTGYPIAQCISSNNQTKIALISVINILFWFWVIHLLWKWFQKR
ncbi:MAG: Uncharacterized protein G01um10147_123 [Microgenomates group bacterium Gr01-1014_7]|nr:MAG: Uncharacterized protein G01um10147_123 [Microgenomates group bacterium Gr01-1014_7]